MTINLFTTLSQIFGSFICGTCLLVIGVQNPIHSILLLIIVFFIGTLLLFVLQMEYYARLFLIVYVGAIVVLFLFIVMILELKIVNVSRQFRDIFSFRYLIAGFIVVEVLLLTSQEFFDMAIFFSGNISSDQVIVFQEANSFLDWSKLLQRTDHLRALGGLLYTEYKFTIIIASLLLFLSRVGALTVTLFLTADSTSKGFFFVTETPIRKRQDVNQQVNRNPILLSNTFRTSFLLKLMLKITLIKIISVIFFVTQKKLTGFTITTAFGLWYIDKIKVKQGNRARLAAQLESTRVEAAEAVRAAAEAEAAEAAQAAQAAQAAAAPQGLFRSFWETEQTPATLENIVEELRTAKETAYVAINNTAAAYHQAGLAYERARVDEINLRWFVQVISSTPEHLLAQEAARGAAHINAFVQARALELIQESAAATDPTFEMTIRTIRTICRESIDRTQAPDPAYFEVFIDTPDIQHYFFAIIGLFPVTIYGAGKLILAAPLIEALSLNGEFIYLIKGYAAFLEGMITTFNVSITPQSGDLEQRAANWLKQKHLVNSFVETGYRAREILAATALERGPTAGGYTAADYRRITREDPLFKHCLKGQPKLEVYPQKETYRQVLQQYFTMENGRQMVLTAQETLRAQAASVESARASATLGSLESALPAASSAADPVNFAPQDESNAAGGGPRNFTSQSPAGSARASGGSCQMQ